MILCRSNSIILIPQNTWHTHISNVVPLRSSREISARNENCDFTAGSAKRCWYAFLAHVYTKRQRQRCDNYAMTLAILLSLKSMETLENGLQTHSGASLQSCTAAFDFIWSDIADASLTLGINEPLLWHTTMSFPIIGDGNI